MAAIPSVAAAIHFRAGSIILEERPMAVPHVPWLADPSMTRCSCALRIVSKKLLMCSCRATGLFRSLQSHAKPTHVTSLAGDHARPDLHNADMLP